MALAKSIHGIWLKPKILSIDLYPQAKASGKEIIELKNNLDKSIITSILMPSQQLQLLGEKMEKNVGFSQKHAWYLAKAQDFVH